MANQRPQPFHDKNAVARAESELDREKLTDAKHALPKGIIYVPSVVHQNPKTGEIESFKALHGRLGIPMAVVAVNGLVLMQFNVVFGIILGVLSLSLAMSIFYVAAPNSEEASS